MNIASIIDFFAFGLFHSLWQVSLLGFLLWITLKCIAEKHAAIRYGIALSFVYAIPILFLVTCLSIAEPSNNAMFSSSIPDVQYWFRFVVLLWLIGIAFPAHKMVRDGIEIYYLMRKRLDPVPTKVQDRFNRLLVHFGIHQDIRIFMSAEVTGPCVIAFWKPIILLPVSCLSHLSLDEIEAVLAHELAHIKRGDGVNRFVQAVIDLIFYYHPILRWMSKQVTIEREHACDDYAKIMLTDSKPLATGILKLGLLQVDNTLLLAAQSTAIRELQRRVQRITEISNPNNKIANGIWQKRSLAIVMLTVMFCGSALMLPSHIVNAAPISFEKTELIGLKDDICDEVNAYELYWTPPYNNQRVADITLENNVIYMNGTSVPEESQAPLLSVFANYELTAFSKVHLRYFGDRVKLTVFPKDNSRNVPFGVRIEPGQDIVEAFRLHSDQSV